MILGYWSRADIQLDPHYVHVKFDTLLSMHAENNNKNRLTDEEAIKDLKKMGDKKSANAHSV